MTFYDLPNIGQTVIATIAYLSFCFTVYLVSTVYFRQNLLPKLLLPVSGLISCFVMLMYVAALYISRLQVPNNGLVDFFCGYPVIPPLLCLLAVLFYDFFVLYKEVQYHKQNLTRTSIKEGLDKVSSGLCYYCANGRVVLSNHRMNQLCHEIVGRDLQNAALFWEILRSGEVVASVTRLHDSSDPTFRLADGSVWAFSRAELDGILQLTASQITDLQAMADELKEKNARLTALNLRLRKYGENIDALSRSRERLEIKARIHRELGQALLASRHYLQTLDENQAPPLEQWKRNVAMLRKEARPPEQENPIDMLRRAARTTGVALSITGEMPEEDWVQAQIVQAAAEALTNAISHATAKTLFIELCREEHRYIARFTNDGIQPTEKIVEGGGLSSLRRKLENSGGVMSVEHSPQFALTVILPRERGDIL